MNKSSIPNIFTFINLSFGIIAIVLCFSSNFLTANLCILASALIDRYDGKIARKINAVSVLGKELDSLSDLVSFGVAPAVAVWALSLSNFGFLSYIFLLGFPICGAFRLARFNVTEFKNVYMGIPITITGSILALDNIVSLKLGVHSIITAIFILLLSYAMVSRIQIKKF